MSWRDTLRLPVSTAAKEGAAKLSRVLQQDVSELFRRRNIPTTPMPPPVIARPSRAHTEAMLGHAPGGHRARTDRADVHDGGDWTASSGAAALALQPRPDLRPRVIDGQDFSPGDLIADTYEITRVLARGNQFTSYVAHHLPWDIDVLIKVPLPHLLQSSEQIHKLAGEVVRWNACGLHPHIAYPYQLHLVDNVPLLILEYIDGGNLRAWINSGRTNNLRVALNLAIQICHGVDRAHTRNLWHAKLTPENILLTTDGVVRLTDFGIARVKDGGAEAYMAPERWVDSEALDPQTDIFSLGVCLYELFCGGRPYEITRGPRRKPPEPHASGDRSLPPALAEMLKSMVDWDRARRPASVEAVGQALCRVYESHYRKPSPFAQLPATQFDADGWNNRGMAALLLGRTEEAEAAWENALATDPNHLEAFYNLGVLRWRRGEIADGTLIQQLQRLKPRSGNSAPLNLLLSLVYLESSNVDAALPLVEELARNTADDPQVKNLLSTARRMHGARRQTVRQLTGHVHFVSSVAISEDGRWALSGSDDASAWLWDLNSGRMVRSFEGHQSRISSVALTPDGRFALTGSEDFSIRLWDAKQGTCLQTIQLQGKVFSVAISADGRRAVSSSSGADNFLGVDGTLVQMWDLESGRSFTRFQGHSNAVKAVAISTDGRRVVTGCDDKMVRIWDANTGECMRILQGHEHYVSCVATNHDGSRVLSGSWDRTMRMWDVQRARCVNVLAAHTGILTSVALCNDGRYAASGSLDGTVRLWDLESTRCLRTFEGHSAMVSGVAVSGDHEVVLSGSWDRTIRVWNSPKAGPTLCLPRLSARQAHAKLPPAEAEADDLLMEAERAVAESRYSDALKYFDRVRPLATDAAYQVRLADLKRTLSAQCQAIRLRNAEPLAQITAPEVIVDAHWSHDGKLFTVGRDSHLRVWDLDTQRCIRTLSGHSDRVQALCVAHDSRIAITASNDTTLKVWDTNTGNCLRTLEGHRSIVSAVAFGDEDRWAVSASYDHTLRLWEIATGRCLQTFKGHTRQVTAVCVSDDSRVIISGGYDQCIRLWDVESGQCLKVLEGHGGPITTLKICDAANLLVSGSIDGTLRMWDLATGTCTHVLEEHSGAITGLALGRAGRWIFSSSTDGSARLWDVANGTCVAVLYRGDAQLSALAVSYDNNQMSVTDTQRTVHLIDLDWELVASGAAPLALTE